MGVAVQEEYKSESRMDISQRAISSIIYSEGVRNVNVDVIQIDFSIWSSVVATVEQIIQNKSVFDIVIFNAGTMFPEEARTSDGVETCFQAGIAGRLLNLSNC
uniref:Short chain dehydrogenase n=1 Tax=Angiostrongylus cantonensis TaxID=6313 RepID=A0A0K0CUF4_ANGCA